MSTYKAEMTVFYNGDDADVNDEVIVSISGGHIELKYDSYHDGQVTPMKYVGTEDGPGHFSLACPEWAGKATLHRFAEASVLEGSWKEEGASGMWKVRLMEKRAD